MQTKRKQHFCIIFFQLNGLSATKPPETSEFHSNVNVMKNSIQKSLVFFFNNNSRELSCLEKTLMKTLIYTDDKLSRNFGLDNKEYKNE